MRLGVVLAPVLIESLSAATEAVTAYERAELHHVAVGGHLLSARQDLYPGRDPEVFARRFPDPFVLFAALATVTERIRLRTSVILLPLYSTPAVARAGADLAALSNGRFDLGVGIGQNELEYEAVGQDFHRRGRRLGEQVSLLRSFWSQPLVSFDGDFHHIHDHGLAFTPPPIPIYIGTSGKPSESGLRRAARLADGWMATGGVAKDVVDQFRTYVEEAERDFSSIAIVGRAGIGGALLEQASAQRDAGATELLLTPSAGPLSKNLDDVLGAVEELRSEGF